MRFSPFLVLIFFIFFSCSKEKTPDSPTPSPKENQKILNIKINDEYNFNGFTIYSTSDSLEIGKSEFEMVVNKEDEFYLIIEGNDDILAVLDVDPSQEEVVLNSTNVAATILDILPSFQALSDEDQEVVVESLMNNPDFLKLTEMVDIILKQHSPIYSEEREFLDLLLKINDAILGNLGLEKNNTTTKSYNKKAPIPDPEIVEWINIQNKTLYNQRHSFISVDINADDGSAGLHELMEPNPFLWGQSSFDLNFQENCYTMDLSQSTDEAFDINYDHAADIFISIVIGKLLKAQGSGKQKCISEIRTQLSKSTSSSLKSIIFNTTSIDDFPFKTAVSTTFDAFLTAFKKEECYTSFLNYKVIAKLGASRMNMLANLIDLGLTVKDGVHLAGFLEGILDPIEDSEKFQLLQDKMIPGCVDIISNSSLNEEYEAGQEIEVSVKVTGSDFFANYELKDFKVEWEIEEGNGELQSTSTLTDEEGVSINSWFLPDTEGTYTISAVLKDNEDDLISVSPMVFTVDVADSISITGEWTFNFTYATSYGSERFSGQMNFYSDSTFHYSYEGLTYSGSYAMSGTWTLNSNNEIEIVKAGGAPIFSGVVSGENSMSGNIGGGYTGNWSASR